MKSCCKEASDRGEDTLDAPQNTDEKAGWLTRLKHKWQVRNILQVVLILCTFALGGSACGYIGRRLMHVIGPDHKALWVIIYVLMVTILWPACVLIISIPLGQFRFFTRYLKKLGNRILGRKPAPNKE
ncbi:DUF6787 family protein [Taibaiella koreensis]|uniref:DUF6787 family protein n=1 Tax=Taibaiella koreensis TaxID=1268548 RepID=UPI000E59B970|nr:DUF6787 family protein [Taibaiella koreensis]